MTHPDPSQAFLERLTARDFAGLTALLAPGAVSRLLLPRGLEEHASARQLTARLEGWFGTASEFEVLATEVEPLGARRRLSWRLRLIREAGRRQIVEQVAFVDIDQASASIGRIDLLCSGFQPDEAAGSTQVFDAGSMGCADGLAEEFRRRIAGVRVGESLTVVVSDPAAREDLPSLARLLGHSVVGTEARADGSSTITVERCR